MKSKTLVRNIVVYGGTVSLCEIMFIVRNFPSIHWVNLTFVDSGFFTDAGKMEIKKYEGSFPCTIEFCKPENVKKSWFDCAFALGVNFRSISPNIYNRENTELRDNSIDVNFPLFSDRNGLKSLVLGGMNLMRYLVTLVKPNGLVVCYPTVVSYEVLSAFDGFKDYRILDHRSEPTWVDCGVSQFPDFSNGPLTLHLPVSSRSDGNYCAAELLTAGKTASDATFNLAETSADVCSLFFKRGLKPVPAPVSMGCCVEKLSDIDYQIDFALLRKPLQFSTRTFQKLQDPSIFSDPEQRRFVSAVYYGGRYQRCCREIRRICREFDERWLNESYQGE